VYRFGGHITCDRCNVIIVDSWNFNNPPQWEIVELQQAGGRRRRMDFCDERCRILYFRGRKYYQKKLQYMKEHGVLE